MYANEKDYWRDYALDAERLGSPLYAQLALAIDGDEALKALTARRRKGQPAANLLFASVHYLLLKGADHPLRDCYATLGGDARADVFALFHDFVFSRRDAVTSLIETRVTNTNEVGRSAILRAGFAALALEEEVSAPLHLIEIGPSAGLNLIWDRYGVRYMREREVAAQILPQAPLVLSCQLHGDGVPPLGVPAIAGRVGLERDPVNLGEADDRDWLRALVWGDQPQRLARLDAAIALYREQPAEIRGGDALTLLPEALAEIPSDHAVCVYHSIMIYQLSAAMKQGLEAILTGTGQRRPVWQLSFEFDGGRDYQVGLTHHRDGGSKSRMLALAQSHGGWLEWRGG